MTIDPNGKSQLLKQVRRGKRMGATQWVRILVLVGAAIQMFRVNEVVLRQGKGSFALLAGAIGIVFVVAVAAMGLGQLEMNERFAALLELMGEKE